MRREFNERHGPVGYVTNKSQADGYRADRPHASTVVCDRPECQQAAIRWVAGETNETAVFRPFRERKATP
jgi:hypothetical protein